MTSTTLHRTLAALLLFVGVGGLFGGLMLVTDPTGASLGMQTSLLAGSPFPDFLVPGVVLLGVNGVGQIAAAGALWWRWRYAGQASAAFGAMLVIWLLVQMSVIGFFWVPPFQPLLLAVGLAEAALGWSVARAA